LGYHFLWKNRGTILLMIIYFLQGIKTHQVKRF